MGMKGSTFCFGCKGSTFMNEQIAGMDSFTSNFHVHYYVFFLLIYQFITLGSQSQLIIRVYAIVNYGLSFRVLTKTIVGLRNFQA